MYENAKTMLEIAELSTKLGILDEKIKEASPNERTVLEAQILALKDALTQVSRVLVKKDWSL